MKLVAWYPDGMSTPLELTSVQVPRGELTWWGWILALSDRVSDLALKEDNPLEVANQACRYLGLPSVDNPNQLGQSLVEGNENLQTHLSLAMYKNIFPAKVKFKQEAKQALEDITLWDWVDLAHAEVSVSSLD
jgi:hypothetical protein